MKTIDRAAPWAALFTSLISYAWRLYYDPARPSGNFIGWWGWFDQGQYIRAARAWSDGVLTSAEHWYLPGYPMLAAPFVRLFPTDPFTVADVLCLAVATLAFCALAQRLLNRPGAATLGAVVWVVTVAVSGLGMRTWVEPWTTTPTTVLTFLSLLLLLRIIDRPSTRDAALLGLTASCVLLFRPTDAAVLLAVTGLWAAAIVTSRRDWYSALAGVAGAGIGLALFAGLYFSIYGWTRSQYLAGSADVGFEWHLLWLRWVTLVVDPAPLVPNEIGLAQAFWWVIPGIMGSAACLVVTRGTTWLRHAAVIAFMTVHLLVYLVYRDLHPQGLMRFHNYHYMKPLLPLLGLYATLLVVVPIQSRARTAGWAVAACAGLLFCWRAEFVPDGRTALVTGPHTLVLPYGIGPLDGAVRVTAKEAFTETYLGEYAMEAGGARWGSNTSVKAEPIPGGFLFIALRPLPGGPATVQFPPKVLLSDTPPPAMGRQRVVFTPPFHWGWPDRAAERFRKWRARTLSDQAASPGRK